MKTQEEILVTGFGKEGDLTGLGKVISCPSRFSQGRGGNADTSRSLINFLCRRMSLGEFFPTVPNFIGLLFDKALTILKGLSCWLLRGPSVPPSKR